MSDIVEFLAARLDEDEAAITAMGVEGAGRWWVGQRFDGSLDPEGSTVFVDVRRSDGLGYIHLGRPGMLAGPTAVHIARHDPMRVLAEVKAKRRCLERHSGFDFPFNPDDGPGDYAWTPRCDGHCHGEVWPCTELLDLAAPFNQHPHYDLAWRVR